MDFIKSHPFLATYLDYVSNTEAPRLFHLWSALSIVSAALGRRCWYPFGPYTIYPNLYVALTGPPALRKGSAMGHAKGLLIKYTNVRFAPDDTGGQRQGLLKAMMSGLGDDKHSDELADIMKDFNEAAAADTLDSISTKTLERLGSTEIDIRDPRTLYIHAGEMNSVLGENNTQLLTFLQNMYDGQPYTYMLKSTSMKLTDALLGMLAGTTPTQISLALPAEAIGQGFMSRCVFVFADVKHARKIARPTVNTSLEGELGERLSKIFNEFSGPFREDSAAATRFDEIYIRGVSIPDPRFVHYAERRHGNLQKLGMVLAAARGDMLIRIQDVDLADQILLFTEQGMPEALGEYGMNKLSVAKQKLVEYARSITVPMPLLAVYGFMQKDMSRVEFDRSIAELHNAGKLSIVDVPKLGKCMIGVSDNSARAARAGLQEISDLLRSA